MKESEAWAKLREALVETASSKGCSIHLIRIENLVGAGVLDSNGCYRGHEFWLEGKQIKDLPLRASTLIKTGLSDVQRGFMVRRLLAGSPTYLWIYINGAKQEADIGWYLFKMDSTELINQAVEGMTLATLRNHAMISVHETASTLLTYVCHGL